MLLGFILTSCGFFSTYVFPLTLKLQRTGRTSADRWKRFFDKWLFRTLHLFGIAYVSFLAILGKYCPLTIWENSLRAKYDPTLTYSGSCIVHYIEKLIYLDVNLLVILIPTIFIAIFTLVVFIIKPPTKVRKPFALLRNLVFHFVQNKKNI